MANRYEYKVVELREGLVGGKMSGDKLEKALNQHASQGWQLKALTSVEVKGRVGPGGVEVSSSPLNGRSAELTQHGTARVGRHSRCNSGSCPNPEEFGPCTASPMRRSVDSLRLPERLRKQAQRSLADGRGWAWVASSPW